MIGRGVVEASSEAGALVTLVIGLVGTEGLEGRRGAEGRPQPAG